MATTSKTVSELEDTSEQRHFVPEERCGSEQCRQEVVAGLSAKSLSCFQFNNFSQVFRLRLCYRAPQAGAVRSAVGLIELYAHVVQMLSLDCK